MRFGSLWVQQMNEIENSDPNRWKSFGLMVVLGLIIAAVLLAIFPANPRAEAPKLPAQVERVNPSPQLKTPRLNGLWENSDGDLMELTENGNEVQIQLIESDRVIRGHGVLTISGDRLAGVLTAEFAGAGPPVEGDFQGRIAGADLIEYSVPGRSGIRRHSASMWRVIETSRSGVLGKVVGITDGDTITVLTADANRIKVRLRGIDAPEKNQPFGASATQLLASLLSEKSVRLVTHGEDRDRRTIGDVFVRLGNSAPRNSEAHVNVMMVQNGLAWHYVQYAPNDNQLAAAQQQANTRKLGLWADSNAIPPWSWRNSESEK